MEYTSREALCNDSIPLCQQFNPRFFSGANGFRPSVLRKRMNLVTGQFLGTEADPRLARRERCHQSKHAFSMSSPPCSFLKRPMRACCRGLGVGTAMEPCFVCSCQGAYHWREYMGCCFPSTYHLGLTTGGHDFDCFFPESENDRGEGYFPYIVIADYLT